VIGKLRNRLLNLDSCVSVGGEGVFVKCVLVSDTFFSINANNFYDLNCYKMLLLRSFEMYQING
jgi:hypothetical protein